MPLVLVHLVLAGLDGGRFHWSSVSLPLQLGGFALVTACWGLVGWTLLTNPSPPRPFVCRRTAASA